MNAKILIQLFTMYSEEVWDCGWINPDAWMRVHPPKVSFEDWLVDRLVQDIVFDEEIDIEDMPTLVESWKNAIDRITGGAD